VKKIVMNQTVSVMLGDGIVAIGARSYAFNARVPVCIGCTVVVETRDGSTTGYVWRLTDPYTGPVRDIVAVKSGPEEKARTRMEQASPPK